MNSASSLGQVLASNRALCPRPLRRQNQILTLYLALYLPPLSTSYFHVGFSNSSDNSSRARKSRKKSNTMRQALPKPQIRPALRSPVLVTKAMEQALGSCPQALASVATDSRTQCLASSQITKHLDEPNKPVNSLS